MTSCVFICVSFDAGRQTDLNALSSSSTSSSSDSQICPATFPILVTIGDLHFKGYFGKSIANLEARNEAKKQKDSEKQEKSNLTHRDTNWQSHVSWK